MKNYTRNYRGRVKGGGERILKKEMISLFWTWIRWRANCAVMIVTRYPRDTYERGKKAEIHTNAYRIKDARGIVRVVLAPFLHFFHAVPTG